MATWLEAREDHPDKEPERAPEPEPPEQQAEPVSLTARRIRNWLSGTFGRRQAGDDSD